MEITGAISNIKDNHFSFQNSQIAKKGCQQKSWQPFLIGISITLILNKIRI